MDVVLSAAMDGQAGRLPTGTVTFLFTDIEKSTRLATELGAAFASRLAEHHAILREAIVEHRGTVVSTEGDSFFAVFSVARDAVAGALAAQRALSDAAPDGREPIRVRMGMHTGRAELGGDNYVGLDLVRAARIMAAAHGGQILISDATATLLGDEPPYGARQRVLGSYRLKDIPEPVELHQIDVAGLPIAFPPLRALDVRRAHMPPEATAFIGRAEELRVLAKLMAERRLVTLTGPGGTGKTRLAIRCAAQVADGCQDGAFFVALATVTNATQIAATTAAAIGLPEERDHSLADVLAEWLENREVLLVLDNLEQIAGAPVVVDQLLVEAPRVRVLATSRHPLHVAGEQEFPVPPFGVPSQGAESAALEASDAVQLFIDRARLIRPGYTPDAAELLVIGDITRRLDGLPLAVELAAARIRLLAPAAIRDRLARRLDGLASGPANAPRRQQSLRETIGWSYDLLEQGERAVFRRLATFVGGCTYEAAAAVAGGGAGDDVSRSLERLADESLIQAVPLAAEPRFTMLATIADYAAELLAASDEEAAVVERHAAYFADLAAQAAAQAEGPAAPAWFDRLEADLDNLRAAIERSEERGNLGFALAISAALGPFWLQRNHSAEGQRTLLRLIDRAPDRDDPRLLAAASVAGWNGTWLGDYALARRMGEITVPGYRRLGDRHGLAFALGSTGFSMIERDPAAALRLIEEYVAISRGLGEGRQLGQSHLARAVALTALGRLGEARAELELAIEAAHGAGDWYFELFSGVALARLKLRAGELAEGMADYRALLEASAARDLLLGVAIVLDHLAEAALWAGDLGRALRVAAAAARIKDELGGGIPPQIGGAVEPLVAARGQLSPEAYDREVAAGRAMSVEAAIAEAQATPIPRAPIPTPGEPPADP